MSASLIEISDAVVADLNGEFSPMFTAKRTYAPTYRLDQISNLQVAVYPASDVSSIIGRKLAGHEYAVAIALTQKVADSENSTIDPLVELAQQIHDRYLGKVLPGRGEECFKGQIIPFDSRMLAQALEFHALVTLILRGARGIP